MPKREHPEKKLAGKSQGDNKSGKNGLIYSPRKTPHRNLWAAAQHQSGWKKPRHRGKKKLWGNKIPGGGNPRKCWRSVWDLQRAQEGNSIKKAE